MTPANDVTTDRDDEDLFEAWFEQGEQGAAPETGDDPPDRGSRRAGVGAVVAAISATALTLALVFAGRV
jgi:hypothetical protein